MSSIETMSDEKFERHALEVLGRELGVDGLARFLRLHRLVFSAFMVKFCFLLAENFSRVLLRPVSMRVRSTFEKLRTSKSCLVPAVPG